MLTIGDIVLGGGGGRERGQIFKLSKKTSFKGCVSHKGVCVSVHFPKLLIVALESELTSGPLIYYEHMEGARASYVKAYKKICI